MALDDRVFEDPAPTESDALSDFSTGSDAELEPGETIKNQTFTARSAVIESRQVIRNASAVYSQLTYNLSGEKFRILTSHTFEGEILPTMARASAGVSLTLLTIVASKKVVSIINQQA